MNKLSPGLAILKTLNTYFANTNYDTVLLVILLVCPAIITTVYLFFGRQSRSKIEVTNTGARRKNMDFFEIVRLQKGLEEFDRDFLYETAEKYHCYPPYNILIDQEACRDVERLIIDDLSEKKIEPNKDKKYQYFMRLKLKLFNN